MTTIAFLTDDRTIPVVAPAMTILDVAIARRIPHLRECGGHARCTTCRVRTCEGIENVSRERRARRRWKGVCPHFQTSPRRHRVQQLARALRDEILHEAIRMNVEAVLLHAGENHAADIVGRRARL
jgi:ferredoxin